MNVKLTRRNFFKLAGAVGTSSLVGTAEQAHAALVTRDTVSVLVDTTRCLGCRSCELACSESKGFPEPPMLGEEAVFEEVRTTGPRAYTVVNRYGRPQGDGEPVFRKSQCMHCLQPACSSACLVKALEKTPEGPVVYHEDRCIGCRYCMVACPFGVPKFEYESALPYIKKCSFCAHRTREGKPPVCAEACPGEALLFGKRSELLDVARTRIYQNPDQYVHHIYGEQEVGGTSWLYISDVPFESLGFPTDLSTMAYPQLTWPFLSAVPFVLTLWPPFLMGLYAFTRSREGANQAEGKEHQENQHG